MHSLGGGTGSGLGTYVLNILEDEFPNVYRFCCVVFPSQDDDVVTSPYNSVLSIHQLIGHADCVLPVDNQSLIEISSRAEFGRANSSSSGAHTGTSGAGNSSDQLFNIANSSQHTYKHHGKARVVKKAYDSMNNIAAHMLCNLTASMRFPGLLNVDLNEITTNLVPFPKLHFLIPATTPIALGKKDSAAGTKRIDEMFNDAIQKDYQLIQCDPRRNRCLATAFLVRGKDITVSDMQRNVARIHSKLDMIYWNKEGFKLGLCSIPPIGQPYSLVSLTNNCCFGDVLQTISDRCMKLYSVRAHLYHYTDYIAQEIIDDAIENIACSIDDYQILAHAVAPPTPSIPRFAPVI
jgi:tubulin epsilon